MRLGRWPPPSASASRSRCRRSGRRSLSLRPSAIFLPAFAQPGPHRSLHPELLIVQQFLEELERLVEFARPDKLMERIRRCASPPDVLRARPSKEISKPGGLRVRHPRDRAGGERVTQGPSGCDVDPLLCEPPRVIVENLFVPAQEKNRKGLLLEHTTGPKGGGEGVEFRGCRPLVGRRKSCNDGSHRRHAQAEDWNRRTNVGFEIRRRCHLWRIAKLSNKVFLSAPDVQRHRLRRNRDRP